MGKRGALIACLVLAVLAGGGLAVLAVRDGGEEPSVGRPETNAGVETSTVPPRDESAGPIRFVLADRYVAGATVDVLIENVGTRAYVYQWPYQACFLRYFDASGRRFIIPPGTHCDLLSEETIRPGERKKVFTWSLDECVKDDWGCVESRPLPPGTYTIKGRFKPWSSGTPARAESTFTIVAA
jgi:hypothetical protein